MLDLVLVLAGGLLEAVQHHNPQLSPRPAFEKPIV